MAFFWNAWDVVGLRTTGGVWNVAQKYGPFAELLFFLIKMEPTCLGKVVGRERDTEDDMSSSEVRGERKVQNFMLCIMRAARSYKHPHTR